MREYRKDKTDKHSIVNRIVLSVVAGALTGLAVTYLQESEKGRSVLAQIGTTVKSLIAQATSASLTSRS